jgi:hypothetical protein
VIDMAEVYWSCLIGGIVFAVITFLAGDIFDHAMDGIGHSMGVDHLDFLNPTTLVSALTSFGGAGVLLSEYTSVDGLPGAILSAAFAIGLGIGLHFLYVRPMRRGENSVAFSMKDFPGLIGSVTIAIPARGYGEVMIRIGAGNTNQIAASFDGRPIAAGLQVVVVEVREDTLMVTPLDDGGIGHEPIPRLPRATHTPV